MDDTQNLNQPVVLAAIQADTKAIEFQMASESLVGSLLRTLAATKPNGRFLDLGTGTGLSAAWLLDAMGPEGRLLSMDNDPAVLDVARRHLGRDERLTLVCEDGDRFIEQLSASGDQFDFIFADTWAGKYRYLDETLNMLKSGGLYIIDDMLPQPNWPEDHPPKAQALIDTLEARKDLRITKMAWSCGVVICAKV